MQPRPERLVLIWLALAVSSNTGIAQPITVQAQQPLAEALSLGAGDWFYASNGAPAPIGPETRIAPGYQRLLLLRRDPDGQLQAERWVELEAKGPSPQVMPDTTELDVDGAPPKALFSMYGVVADDADRLLASPRAMVRLTLSDPGGVETWRITDSHPQSSEAGRWSEGEHLLTATARDGLGNAGPAGTLRFTVDAQGPEIDWSLASPGLDGENGEKLFSPPVTLRVSAADAAGVESLRVLKNGQPMALESGGTVTVDVDTVEIEASDALGNRRSVQARWNFDQAGPRIDLTPDANGRLRGNRIYLPVEGSVQVQISDDGAGVASGRYRYNHKPWSDLPERIRFMHRGHYRVEVEATDRLGNRSVKQFQVRTRGRPGRRGGGS